MSPFIWIVLLFFFFFFYFVIIISFYYNSEFTKTQNLILDKNYFNFKW